MEKSELNPTLVVKCAELAKPGMYWRISGDNDAYSHVLDDYFNPLNCAKNRDTLLLALLNEGWKFSKNHGLYSGVRIGLASHIPFKLDCPTNIEQHQSWPMLLVQCVAAQFGIPMYE